jgi:MFS family permease
MSSVRPTLTTIGEGTERARRQLRRAVVAASLGSIIEWYDFLIYGTAAGLYLGKLFFPSSDPLLSTLAAWSTFAVGFVIRPIGGLIFGHQGDRIGRKATLIVTLTLMGVSTFLIGLVPTYSQIGPWGGVILILLRLLQGLAVGGEWGGAVLVSVEWAGARRRGLVGAFAQLGIPAGLVLGFIMLRVSTAALGPASYWGWRLPFLVSILLVVIGLYVRLGVLETPVFSKLLEERGVEPRPSFSVLRKDFRNVILTTLIKTGQFGPNVIFNTFILTYLTVVLKVPQSTALIYIIIPNLVSCVTTLYFGHLSDRVGRKRLSLIGYLGLVIWGVPYYLALGTKIGLVMVAAMVVAQVINDSVNGPQPALFAEAFPGRRRYSGASFGFQMAALTAGGPAPILATWLVSTFHSGIPVGLYVAASGLLGLIAMALFMERPPRDLAEAEEEAGARPRVAPA